MKITNQTQYTVWIRPRGSHLWTIRLKPCVYHSDRRLANNLASKIAEEEGVCAIVRELHFPKDPDPEESPPYIEIQDGEGMVERFERDSFFIPVQERRDLEEMIADEEGGAE
jgi:hypothetical protein